MEIRSADLQVRNPLGQEIESRSKGFGRLGPQARMSCGQVPQRVGGVLGRGCVGQRIDGVQRRVDDLSEERRVERGRISRPQRQPLRSHPLQADFRIGAAAKVVVMIVAAGDRQVEPPRPLPRAGSVPNRHEELREHAVRFAGQALHSRLSGGGRKGELTTVELFITILATDSRLGIAGR